MRYSNTTDEIDVFSARYLPCVIPMPTAIVSDTIPLDEWIRFLAL